MRNLTFSERGFFSCTLNAPYLDIISYSQEVCIRLGIEWEALAGYSQKYG